MPPVGIAIACPRLMGILASSPIFISPTTSKNWGLDSLDP